MSIKRASEQLPTLCWSDLCRMFGIGAVQVPAVDTAGRSALELLTLQRSLKSAKAILTALMILG
jgi:hypothetical protein